MNQEERKRPEEFLEALKLEEQAARGQLKIFIGMAAGVGKTYAMLEEAQKLKAAGIDIVVGIVNTHGRQETEALLAGLPLVPEKTVMYKEIEFKELDVDGIIQRQPAIVLVDELAHHNIPGSKHEKRWQDVMELLENGINVFTTLNVQHIESLNDIVRGITEVAVRETVPDQIIEKASSIQLVDLTPDGLLQRLKEGKVYLGDQSQMAIEHFFQKDRLTALREMVLRYAANKVDLDLRKMIMVKEGIIEWRPREKLLVAVNHNPHAQKLIRIGRRLAVAIDAPWLAVYVDNGQAFSEKDTQQLAKNLALARDLGAEVITLHDSDIALGIKRIATQRGVTQIILGREPVNPLLALFKRQPLLDKLVAECKDIDIHVIRQEKHTIYRKKMNLFGTKVKWLDYLTVCVSVAVISLVCWLTLPIIGYKTVGFIFILGILSLSLFFNKGPILFASLLYALLWKLFFIPPYEKHNISSKEDIAIMFLYLLTGLTIGILVDRARKQKDLLLESEKTTSILYEIVRTLSSNLSTEEILNFIKERISRLLEGTCELAIKQTDDSILFEDLTLLTNEKEKSAAIWAYENGKEAGWSTDTLPLAQNLYFPLKGLHEVVGVLIFKPLMPRMITVEEKNFLHTVSQQLSNFLERTFTMEKTKQREYLRRVEQVYNTILHRFSLVFEVSILSTRSSIKKLKKKLAALSQTFPEIEDIDNSFDIFTKIMNNISAMTQLSETMVPLRKTRQPIHKVVEECCEEASEYSKEHKINANIEENLPVVSIDYHLIQILLQNLLLNAIEHSSPGTTISVEVRKSTGYIILSVSDEGKGIPETELEAIFEKFYRSPDETTPGIGLGLAIAKTIAEIHHGTLKAENLPVRGAKFTLSLPIKEML